MVRSLALLLVALAVTTTACSQASDQADDPAALYQANCASCHGADGSGGVGGSIIDQEYQPAPLADLIRNGMGTMPAFGRTLSEAEVDALVDFVRNGFEAASAP